MRSVNAYMGKLAFQKNFSLICFPYMKVRTVAHKGNVITFSFDRYEHVYRNSVKR